MVRIFHLVTEEVNKNKVVAEGVCFSDNVATMRFSGLSSYVVHDTIQNIDKLHCSDGRTKIKFLSLCGSSDSEGYEINKIPFTYGFISICYWKNLFSLIIQGFRGQKFL